MSWIPSFKATAKQAKVSSQCAAILDGKGSTEEKVRGCLKLAWDSAVTQNNQPVFAQFAHLVTRIAESCPDRTLQQAALEMNRCTNQTNKRKLIHDLLFNNTLIALLADQLNKDLAKVRPEDMGHKSIQDLISNAAAAAKQRASQAQYGPGELGVRLYELIMFTLELALNPIQAVLGKEPYQLNVEQEASNKVFLPAVH